MNLLKKKRSNTSLFKPKNTPEFQVQQTKIKQSILRSLSRAIKEVQCQFTNQDPSIESPSIRDGRCSDHVCVAFEEVLKHGLKQNWFGQKTFWPAVLKISRKQTIDFIGSLRHAQSDSSKCRGWIRVAVNDGTFASYLNVLCQDHTLLSSYYEPFGFVRDVEMVSTLTDFLGGLSQISFKLTVDIAGLEFDSVPEVHSDMPIRMKPNSVTSKVSSSSSPPSSIVVQKKPSRGNGRRRDRTKRGHEGAAMAEERECLSSPSGSNLSLDRPPRCSTSISDVSSCEPARDDNASANTSAEELPEDGCGFIATDDMGFLGSSDGLECVNGIETRLAENGSDVELNHSFSDEDTGWDYWKKTAANEIEPESLDVGVALIGQSNHAVKPPVSLGNLPLEGTEEELVWEKEMDIVPMSSSHPDRKYPPGRESPSLCRGSPPRFISNSDASYEGLLSECRGHQGTIDGPAAKSPSNTLTSNSCLPRPSNPFDADTLAEPTLKGPWTNPFGVDPESTLSFADTFLHLIAVPEVPCPPTNPFLSTPDTSAIIPSPEQQDMDGRCNLSLTSPAPASSSISSLPRSPSSSEVSPRPGYLDTPPPHPGPPVPSLSPIPPDCPFTDPLRGVFPGPAPSSVRLHPLRSQGSDDVESCSSSSVDLASFLDTTSLPRSNHENHFMTEVNVVNVQLALDKFKVVLVYSQQTETEKDMIRKKIVQLQMKLQQLKDDEEEDTFRDSSVREVHGHQLVVQARSTGILFRLCEGCGKRVRGLFHTWYLCKLCGFSYHKKCLSCVERVCSASIAGNSPISNSTPNYILDICPENEKGLTYQHFRCAQCNVALSCSTTPTRLCDYCGLYYCTNCHHNDAALIPARVIHNWDFTSRKVCCKCCDYLERFCSRPLLRVRRINPLMYTYVPDLTTIENMRKDILEMKKYFIKCSRAKEKQLFKRLDNFPHFKDGADRFSLVDLEAVQSGSLLPQLSVIHRDFTAHIKSDCPVCSVEGYRCDLCKSDEVLYKFDRRCRPCPKCTSVYHRNCYSEMTACPNCSRTRSHRKQID